ncbi:DUF5606 domain-containing protein [Pontibacter sp. HSC-14F20]|uniref:DUF5606 family protein n=1 Tax=Pontibacter sp. HSC-14F20 TaxID=2864136 RepID=UPI001C72E762|nr:DUF5606 domain-containing protein [Pontibacter sp. HSC-14F20]MBX0333064.1 DUF5606 domain-containing protein [Pontibacter sp. HSC-14F20]
MPIDLRQVSAIAGMSGLYRIVKPTRNGVIVESLSDKPTRMVAQARHRMSLLDEISIYTNDEEATVPLADVMDRIHQKYNGELPFGEKPSDEELKSFMSDVLPDYDEDRVYISDMRKLATWYGIVNKHVGFSADEAPASDEKAEEGKEEKAESKAKKAKK